MAIDPIKVHIRKAPTGRFDKPIGGSPQGGIISPVLANIYLHNALDLWFEKKIKPRMRLQKLNIWLPQLKRKLRGFSNYFGLPDNSRSLSIVSTFVRQTLYKWLNRRSGRRSCHWRSLNEMLGYFQIEPLRVKETKRTC